MKVEHIVWFPPSEPPDEDGQYLIEWGDWSRTADWDSATGHWRDTDGCSLGEGDRWWARLPVAPGGL